MTISPEMLKLVGSIASSAMSSKDKSEKQVQPKANTQWHVDFQEPKTPLNNRGEVSVFNTRPLSTRLKGVAVNDPSLEIKGDTSGIENLKKDIPKPKPKSKTQQRQDKRQANLEDRTTARESKRSKRIDARELRRKTRFEARDANEGKTYQEKRGTDVGNFFRRFSNPAASQNPPTNGGNTNATNYDDDKEEAKTKYDDQFYKSDMYLNRVKPSQFGLKDIDHTKVNQD